METRYLNTLITAVEAGTFSKASEILHITQSAVSQRIKFLEDHFGQQLLDRSGQRLALTPAGQVVFNKAKEILEKEKELLNCLEESISQKRLSFCCTPTFGMAFLPRVLNNFLRVHSDLNDLKFIFLQPEQALKGLRLEEFDLAVIEHHPSQSFSGFDRFTLPDDEMLLVVSSLNPPPNINGYINIDNLKDYRLYARRDGCSSKELMRCNLKSLGLDFNDFSSVVVSDDLRFTIQAVIANEGMSFMSKNLVQAYLDSGEMIGLHVKGFEHRRGRSVVMVPDKKEDPFIQELIESIFEVVTPLWRPQLLEASG
jgi:DNA-binding transcriptional LysR family regulator